MVSKELGGFVAVSVRVRVLDDRSKIRDGPTPLYFPLFAISFANSHSAPILALVFHCDMCNSMHCAERKLRVTSTINVTSRQGSVCMTLLPLGQGTSVASVTLRCLRPYIFLLFARDSTASR